MEKTARLRTRISRGTTPAEAVERGFLWAVVAPRGNVISMHEKEGSAAKAARYVGVGCRVDRTEKHVT